MHLTPPEDRPIRWLPRHGQPFCIIEFVSQAFVRGLAWAPLYTAVMVTLILLAVVITR